MNKPERDHHRPASGPHVHLAAGAARLLVQELPDPLFFEFLKATGPDCFRGFKVDRRNAGSPILRARLATDVARQPDLARLLLAWERAPWGEWQAALQAFESKWLKRHWRHLATDQRGLCLLAAGMAGDTRPEVAGRGRRLLARTALWEEGRPWTVPAKPSPAALALLRRALAPTPPTAAAADPPATAAPPPPPDPTPLRHENDELRSNLDRLKTRLQESQAETVAKADDAEQRQRDMRRQVRQLDERCQALERDMQQRVDQEVARVRRELLGFGEAPPRVDAAAAGPLLERVTRVLDEHRRLDERYGTVSAIRDEVAHLERAAQDLAECADESVRVLPELAVVRRDVEARLREQRAVLGNHDGHEASEAGEFLLREVRSAEDSAAGRERLAAVAAALDLGPVRDLLGEPRLAQVREALRHRQDRLAFLERERALAGVLPLPAATPAHLEPREVWDLADALRADRQPRRPCLVVDGYNVSKNADGLSNIDAKAGLAEARRRLLELCRTRAGQFSHLELVFDGDGLVVTREDDGLLTVVFAPRRRPEQNADDWIVDRLPQLLAEFGRIWLVTADGGLRERARRLCDAFVSPADFAAFLNG